MALPRSYALLRQVADLFPSLPITIEVLSDTSGALRLELLSHNGRVFQARGPRLRVHPRMRARARVGSGPDDRYEIDLIVTSVAKEDDWSALLNVEVTEVVHRNGRRTASRLHLAEPTELFVVACRELEANERFEVMLADLSAAGVAFTTDRHFSLGDVVALMPNVGGQPMRLRGRVLHTEELEGGLRVGCELMAIRDDDRRRLDALAADDDAAA
jgi:PilZ domain